MSSINQDPSKEDPSSKRPEPKVKKSISVESDEGYFARVILPKIAIFAILVGLIFFFSYAITQGWFNLTKPFRIVLGYALGGLFFYLSTRSFKSKTVRSASTWMFCYLGTALITTHFMVSVYAMLPIYFEPWFSLIFLLIALYFGYRENLARIYFVPTILIGLMPILYALFEESSPEYTKVASSLLFYSELSVQFLFFLAIAYASYKRQFKAPLVLFSTMSFLYLFSLQLIQFFTVGFGGGDMEIMKFSATLFVPLLELIILGCWALFANDLRITYSFSMLALAVILLETILMYNPAVMHSELAIFIPISTVLSILFVELYRSRRIGPGAHYWLLYVGVFLTIQQWLFFRDIESFDIAYMCFILAWIALTSYIKMLLFKRSIKDAKTSFYNTSMVFYVLASIYSTVKLIEDGYNDILPYALILTLTLVLGDNLRHHSTQKNTREISIFILNVFVLALIYAVSQVLFEMNIVGVSGQLGLQSALLGLFAVALFFFGWKKDMPFPRKLSFYYLGLVFGKMLFIDLAGTSVIMRAALFIGLGIIGLVISHLYNKFGKELEESKNIVEKESPKNLDDDSLND